MDSLELAHLLVDSLLEKKGQDITLIDLREQSIFADYFLICTGENDRQLKALAQSVLVDARKEGMVVASGKEGLAESGWVLIDFEDLIIHLFLPEKRAFYNLEALWADAHTVLHMQ